MTGTPAAQAGGARPVCVVTAPGDATADQVVLELLGMGTPVFRLHPADFPGRVWLNAWLGPAGWTGTVSAGDRTVLLEEIGAIWWWHPDPPRIPPEGLSGAERDWAAAEARAGLFGVLASLDCLHVNHPGATRAAQSKPGVLATAARLGLDVPPTWTGNHPAAARTFAASGPRGAVCKSLVRPGIDAPGGHRVLHTTPVTPHDLGDGITGTAHQLQHRIPKTEEVRLTVVGGRMFPARITAHSPAGRTDFRADYEHLTYRYCTSVPDRVRDGVAALTDHYQLSYAALDLLIDPDDGDRWWLVDVNPAGQHGWIQAALPALGITQALARLLTTHHPDLGGTR